MELSKRLLAVANMVTPNTCIVDVGTDHGYIPIYLVANKKNKKAIAMDINQGPLKRAKYHIAEEHLEHAIETRLSDGLEKLDPKEGESIVIAGMGGGLIIKILDQGNHCLLNCKELILQPQSEVVKVRKFLNQNGFIIVAEDMVFEEGKFYPILKAQKGKVQKITKEELLYGVSMLEQQHPVLCMFLEKEIRSKESVIEALQQRQGSHIEQRIKELQEEVTYARTMLYRYYEKYRIGISDSGGM